MAGFLEHTVVLSAEYIWIRFFVVCFFVIDKQNCLHYICSEIDHEGLVEHF